MNDEQHSIDSNFISKWLDQNPQFLTEYLRKMQVQRRHAIMSDEINQQMLTDLYSNLRLQPHSLPSVASSTFISLQETNKLLSKVDNLFNSKERNEADDHHNATGQDDEDDFKINKNRKQFKELGLYEKMYALVKTLYQSLDLKTTCKKILKTVSLLLEADRYVDC